MIVNPSSNVLNKILSVFWKWVFPLCLLFILFKNFDFKIISQYLIQAHLGTLYLAFGLFALPIMLRSLRWHLILQKFGITCTFRATLNFYLVGYAFQFFLPTGLGDTVRLFYLTEKENSIIPSISSIVLDKGMDYFSFLLFGMLGILILPRLIVTQQIYIFLLIASSLSFCGFIFIYRQRHSKYLKFFMDKHIVRFFKNAIIKFTKMLKDLTQRDYFLFGSLSLIAALIHNTSFYFISLALGLELSYIQVLGICGILYLILSIPIISITVGGLGVRESILVITFSILSLPPESAIAFSLLMFGISVFWHAIAICAWVFKPVNMFQFKTTIEQMRVYYRNSQTT